MKQTDRTSFCAMLQLNAVHCLVFAASCAPPLPSPAFAAQLFTACTTVGIHNAALNNNNPAKSPTVPRRKHGPNGGAGGRKGKFVANARMVNGTMADIVRLMTTFPALLMSSRATLARDKRVAMCAYQTHGGQQGGRLELADRGSKHRFDMGLHASALPDTLNARLHRM